MSVQLVGNYLPIQRLCDGLASGVGAEITVIALNLHRVAGTGPFRDSVGKCVPDYYLSSKAIRTGETLVVDAPGRHRLCADCRVRDGCTETIAIATPIVRGSSIIGAIAVVGTTEHQRARLSNNVDGLRYMFKEVSTVVGAQLVVPAERSKHRAITFDHIIGDSPPILEAKLRAARAAGSHANILLLGETGTGKELFARAIHAASDRSHGPFIAVNCGAIPEGLFESELFGYEEGAFTGARRGGKPGIIELARGGTLFLDEVGDLPLQVQGKLLRALEQKEVLRIGAKAPVHADFRLITATHKDLQELVDRGLFRSDLFYRINVVPIRIPPLRERAEDIPLLIQHFMMRHSWERRTPLSLTDEALRALMTYPWPGNVRELENLVEYFVVMAKGSRIGLKDLPSIYLRQGSTSKLQGGVIPLKELERMAVEQALELYGRSGEGKRAAARALGIDVSTLYRKIKRYSIRLS